MTADIRVCFIGDSFVAGFGDPHHLGWVGRLAAGSDAAGVPITAYTLGIRRDTSADVRARLLAECAPRLPAGCDARVVVSFGVNDATPEGDGSRLRHDESVANLTAVLHDVAAAGWRAFVVGPPPIDDEGTVERTVLLDRAFADLCDSIGVPYVSVVEHLRAAGAWMSEVRAGDGAHPGAGGYAELADLVRPEWDSWLRPITPG